MRRIALAVATVIGLTACQQMTTEPASNSNLTISMFGSNPPPPPIDSGSVGYTGTNSPTFTLTTRYFFNKTDNNGWLKFDSDIGDVSVDKNAQIRYSQGVFSGKGIITVGDLVIDLSKVSQSSQFGNCNPWGTPVVTTDAAPTSSAPPVGCFNLVIDNGAGPTIYLTEKCPNSRDVYDPRAVCKGRIG